MAPRHILKRFGYTALVATIVARFSRWLNSPCRLTDSEGKARDRQWIGDYGERVAVDFLRAKGHRILKRNFKGPRRGEVDIIARHDRLLLFVEVKTRRSDTKIRPLDAVDKTKQQLIERGANAWLKLLKTRNLPWRFDVIEILIEEGEIPKINHVKDAF